LQTTTITSTSTSTVYSDGKVREQASKQLASPPHRPHTQFPRHHPPPPTRHDPGSAKAIANRIKAKGLQKLKYYCQLCNKQCRDDNGFKCHLTSEAHLRQMEVFGQNPRRVIEDFSSQFLKAFLEHLKRTHPFSRVEANHVYNDFISDREHVHMNATKWTSLTEFVKWMGREGICKVDETEKGWFIKLVREEDPMERKKREREEAEKESDERHLKALRAQAAKAKKAREENGGVDEDGFGDEVRHAVQLDGLKDVTVTVKDGRREKDRRVLRSTEVFASDKNDKKETQHREPKREKPKSNVELLMEREMAKKQAAASAAADGMAAAAEAEKREKDAPTPWLCKGIVVKVVSPSLKEHGYWKKKGVVVKVSDGGFLAEIEMLNSGDVVRVDQAELETVVPGVGKAVMVVKGRHRGKQGTLKSIDEARYGALIGGLSADQGADVFLEYEDFSKLSSS